MRRLLLRLWGTARLWRVRRKLAQNGWEPYVLTPHDWRLLERYDRGTFHNLRDFAEECQ